MKATIAIIASCLLSIYFAALGWLNFFDDPNLLWIMAAFVGPIVAIYLGCKIGGSSFFKSYLVKVFFSLGMSSLMVTLSLIILPFTADIVHSHGVDVSFDVAIFITGFSPAAAFLGALSIILSIVIQKLTRRSKQA